MSRLTFRTTVADSNSYYTLIPPKPPTHTTARSFCLLPASTHPLYTDWRSSTSSLAPDEVSAHIGMFNPTTNEAFYTLGLDVSRSILEAVEYARERDKALC